MNNKYDAIVIGAGHNGLVSAAKLAMAGLKVLVIEKRDSIGGIASTEEIIPGYKFNVGSSDAGMFQQKIVNELDLHKHGLQLVGSDVSAISLLGDKPPLVLWKDEAKSVNEIKKYSKKDAENYPSFLKITRKFSSWLANILLLPPPDPMDVKSSDLLPWLKIALKTRGLGNKDMMELLRVLPMPVADFLDDWFESEALKGLLAAPSVIGSMQGPQSSGTAFTYLYMQTGGFNSGFRSSRLVKGGISNLSAAIADKAKLHGAKLLLSSSVSQIIIKDYKAVGVELTNGDTYFATVILSNADPRQTLTELAPPTSLEPREMRRVNNIRFKGSTAKINLALDQLPTINAGNNSHGILSGHIVISPSMDYLEKAHDDAKYGEISKQPYFDITLPSVLDDSIAPPGKHVMSIDVKYTPYDLKTGTWETQSEELYKTVINLLSTYMPDIEKPILGKQIITPLDYEYDYSLTEGGIFHGQMGLDQLLFMRPIAGFGRYETPIGNLFLCGAGTHPGGGVTGAPGYNAANAVIKKLAS